MCRSIRQRGLLLLAALSVLILACGEHFQDMDPGRIRAYHIAIEPADGAADTTLCLVSVPEGYDPDRTWPAVIALHGYGSGAARFHAVWQEAAATSGCVLMTPQGEKPTGEGVGWCWGQHTEEILRRSMEAAMSEVRIDPSRVFLSGFSQGGTLTYEIAIRRPHLFRGIAPIGAGRSLAEFEDLHAISHMRVYIGHGELEPNLQGVRGLAAHLDSIGCTVVLREYPGVGHRLPDPATAELKHLLSFLMQEE